MEQIQSEAQFVWKFILGILAAPFNLLLVLFGRRSMSDVLKPFSDLISFMFEPRFTITIIGLNILAFLASVFFIPQETLMGLINKPQDLVEWKLYTLITAGFLHASVSHLVWNMLGIFIFGRVVERKLGEGKTALVYFGALVLSSLFTSLIHLLVIKDNIGGLGASGALMGLVSTAILLDPFYFTHELIIPLPIMVAGWLAIYADISGILNPVEEGIGHFAHLGGFISIGILMFLLGGEERSKLRQGLLINIVSLAIGLAGYFFLIHNGYVQKIV